MIVAVTSFSKKGWQEYAQRFVDTALEHWPSDVTLACYYEFEKPPGHFPKAMNAPTLDFRDLYQIPGAEEFLSKTATDQFKGLYKDPQDELQYNFRFDAHRFSRKIFSMFDAWSRIVQTPKPTDSGRRLLMWSDADVVTFKDIPREFFSSLLPEDKALSYLGREHINSYPECGWWVVDVDHVATSPFMQVLWNFYTSGAFVFCKEWHDCYMFEVTRRLVQMPSHSIAPQIQDLHVYIHSPLGQYMDHLKGPTRKKEGFSPEHPLIEERQNDVATEHGRATG